MKFKTKSTAPLTQKQRDRINETLKKQWNADLDRVIRDLKEENKMLEEIHAPIRIMAQAMKKLVKKLEAEK